MADYTIQIDVTCTKDVDARELQVTLNDPDTRKRLAEVLGRGLSFAAVPERKKYPEAAVFGVGSVTVQKK